MRMYRFFRTTKVLQSNCRGLDPYLRPLNLSSHGQGDHAGYGKLDEDHCQEVLTEDHTGDRPVPRTKTRIGGPSVYPDQTLMGRNRPGERTDKFFLYRLTTIFA